MNLPALEYLWESQQHIQTFPQTSQKKFYFNFGNFVVLSTAVSYRNFN